MTAQTILPANTLSSGYDVANSCRFDGTSSYMTKTLGTPTSAKKGTISYWFKQGSVNTGTIKTAFSFGSEYGAINYDTGTTRGFEINLSNGNGWYKGTNEGFTARDPSAWWHLMVVVDTTQGTEANRFKFYMNGSQITFTSGNNFPSSNGDIPGWASGQVMQVGRRSTGSANYFDGYMAEVVFIDGSALTPSDFGEYDSDSPTIWKPKDVSGLTFGNNGFYLDFEDSSNLGNDANGGTDLTETGLDATNQSTDTCTNNFATMNPLFVGDTNITYAEGNLKTTAANESQKNAVSTIAVSSGKWYCEMVSRNGTNYPGFGIMDSQSVLQTSISYLGSSSDSYCMFQGGLDYNNGTESNIGTTWGVNSIMGVAIDLDSGTKTIKYYKAGSEIHSRTISTPANAYVFAVSHNTNGTITEINFGSPPYSESGGNSDGNGYGNFNQAVPSGYYALNTKNLSEFG